MHGDSVPDNDDQGTESTQRRKPHLTGILDISLSVDVTGGAGCDADAADAEAAAAETEGEKNELDDDVDLSDALPVSTCCALVLSRVANSRVRSQRKRTVRNASMSCGSEAALTADELRTERRDKTSDVRTEHRFRGRKERRRTWSARSSG